jgi:hypothetical protein
MRIEKCKMTIEFLSAPDIRHMDSLIAAWIIKELRNLGMNGVSLISRIE